MPRPKPHAIEINDVKKIPNDVMSGPFCCSTSRPGLVNDFPVPTGLSGGAAAGPQ
jgi:hypothetical protein